MTRGSVMVDPMWREPPWAASASSYNAAGWRTNVADPRRRVNGGCAQSPTIAVDDRMESVTPSLSQTCGQLEPRSLKP